MGGNLGDELQNLIERYERAGDSRLFAPLADAYRKKGDTVKAIEILEQGLERFPQYASGRVILGKCFYDTGATERAKAEFRRVLEIDADNMVALKYLGDILLAEERRPEAADCYRKLLAIDPLNEEVSRSLKEIEHSFVAKEIDLADGKRARDERPRDLATITLAGIYAAQGYHNKALAIYRDVLAREPSNREAKEMLAKLQSMLDSGEGGREGSVEEPVLTISIDDVGDDIASSTVGRGGSEAGVRAELAREMSVEAGEGADGKASLSAPETGAPAADSGEKAPAGTEEAPPQGESAASMDQFREWLKKHAK